MNGVMTFNQYFAIDTDLEHASEIHLLEAELFVTDNPLMIGKRRKAQGKTID